jgi:hypothetical protein
MAAETPDRPGIEHYAHHKSGVRFVQAVVDAYGLQMYEVIGAQLSSSGGDQLTVTVELIPTQALIDRIKEHLT